MAARCSSRREFLRDAGVLSAGAWLAPKTLAERLASLPVVAQKFLLRIPSCWDKPE